MSSIVHASFSVGRLFPVAAARVFQAFADPALKRRWFAVGDQHTVEEFVSDLREGGAERLRYRFNEGTLFPGAVIASQDAILMVVPEQRIVWTSTMTFRDRVISIALVTAELAPAGDGAELTITFQGMFFEGSDGPEMREMGWRKLLENLAGLLS
jgi:uncharacterized protein YndB with AHSA1/START domain